MSWTFFSVASPAAGAHLLPRRGVERDLPGTWPASCTPSVPDRAGTGGYLSNPGADAESGTDFRGTGWWGMNEELRATAAWLLKWSSDRNALADPTAAAEHVFGRVCSQLGVLVGAEGCRALLTRAVERARADHPLLAPVEIDTGGEPRLRNLKGGTRDSGPEIQAALEQLLAELMTVVGRLLGADLLVRLLRREWPDIPHPFPRGNTGDDSAEAGDPQATDGSAGAG